jgi:hypothetical protein
MAAAATAAAAPDEIVLTAVTPALGVTVPARGAFFSFSSFSHCFTPVVLVPALSSLSLVPGLSPDALDSSKIYLYIPEGKPWFGLGRRRAAHAAQLPRLLRRLPCRARSM